MSSQYIQKLEPELKRAIDYLKNELKSIHIGRASVSLVSDIFVESYGAKAPLKQLANISAPDPKSIVVQPWDKSILNNIEKTIRESDLDLNPVNTGELVRINIPSLTEERRKDFIKLVRDKAEEAKVSIRNNRHDIWSEVKNAKSKGEISEDDFYRQEQEIQKIVNNCNKEIDEIMKKKEKELMEI